MILTKDQTEALENIKQFLLSKDEYIYVLEGYSGTGKSTLIKTLLKEIDPLNKTFALINNKSKKSKAIHRVYLTATTNKAAENLEQVTGQECTTIYSMLSLVVDKDLRTGNTFLRQTKNATIHTIKNSLIVIDEASCIDRELMQWILGSTLGNKLLFVGDPAQLLKVRSKSAVVFNSKFPTSRLSEVVRQANHSPIIDLSTMFRNTVETGEFFSFKPDGVIIVHVSREEYDYLLAEEFCRKDWKHHDSKILAWTNKRVMHYNNIIRHAVHGTTDFLPGDYAISNRFVANNTVRISADEIVMVQDVETSTEYYGVTGNTYQIKNHGFFCPNDISEMDKVVLDFRKTNQLIDLQDIERSVIDLRPAYASTVNKAQGSTYDQVFIDLDDIKKCRNGDTLARMLYVAVSRARNKVVLVGDLV